MNTWTETYSYDCPECGCGECAQTAVTCICCGNSSFFQGDAETRFYNYELECPHCGKVWLGHYATNPECSAPAETITTLHGSIGTAYIGKSSSSGKYEIYWYAEQALQNCEPGTVTDNCGNELETEAESNAV